MEENTKTPAGIQMTPTPTIPNFEILNGIDDGGIDDLKLLLDLDDNVNRRRLGDKGYLKAQMADMLPRYTSGGRVANMDRGEQKLALAELICMLKDNPTECADDPSCCFVNSLDGGEDAKTMKDRTMRLSQAKSALRLSICLLELACISTSLSELCKRYLALKGQAGADKALRYADQAVEVAGNGCWKLSEIAMEVSDAVEGLDDEKTAKITTALPGLANKSQLDCIPIRVSHLCMRQALMQRSNALLALGRQTDARETYERIIPLLADEPRYARVDWERYSIFTSIGDTYSKDVNDFESANEYYQLAEKLGMDHVSLYRGSKTDGYGMIDGAKRARAFALTRNGRREEAKLIFRNVIESQIRLRAQKQINMEAVSKNTDPKTVSTFSKLLEQPISPAISAPSS